MTSFVAANTVLLDGDCLAMLPTLDENSVDACVTDPPYHLTTTGTGETGFMGKEWDGGDIAFRPDIWREVLRALKPGAHLVAFGGTRTYHRLACAIEDAGFEIRDCVQWLYGTGFPKSHDVSKGIDRAAGAEREVTGEDRYAARRPNGRAGNEVYGSDKRTEWVTTAPATDAARQWQGWGTALKPACELIVLARKPLSEDTVAANVLRWGTGAINIERCRIETTEGAIGKEFIQPIGRWPANVIHDGSAEVVDRFPKTTSIGHDPRKSKGNPFGGVNDAERTERRWDSDDSTSAARFFYCAKASKAERRGSKHPTVKPIKLMRYLARLITPPKGTILDPFAGTGTTGEASYLEDYSTILIEREEEYISDITRRMAAVEGESVDALM